MRYVMEQDIINDEECHGCKFLVKNPKFFCNLLKMNVVCREEKRPEGLYLRVIRNFRCPFKREEKPTK